ncbi:unnamed protein product [Cyclocybe aegerita]|uniref:Cytochrome P450 n=1 Tax=Cyclocybe aegerita TaxID=1973307 RepID=A0A8S0W146_CYCAE|nr:unnamed protein product [Cyclocybe aegerita]
MVTYTTAFYYALSALAVWSLLQLRKKRFLPLPPGPSGFPLIGNVYDIPHDYPWHTYAEWAKKYGDIIHLNVFGHETILLNSAKAAIEILDKRSSNYSDRPRMTPPTSLASLYPVHKQTTITLLEQLSNSPERFVDHIRQYVGSAVLRAAYGYTVKILLGRISAFPAIYPRTVAWGWFQTNGPGFAEEFSCSSRYPLRQCQTRNGEWISRAVLQEVIKNCAGLVYLAGSDTTASLLLTWMLAMARYLEVQARAQSEVDAVTRGLRLPDFDDRNSAPYLDAMITETMRWHPVTPMALPHRAMSQDVYEGYRIPAGTARFIFVFSFFESAILFRSGTTVTANTWAILHDETMYPEPFDFQPERFLQSKDGGKDGVCPDPFIMGAFGFGRRICPGRYLALNSAWIAIASILSLYTISKFVEEDGTVVEPTVEFTDGLVSHPKPYRIKLISRRDVNKALEAAKLEDY